MGLDANAISALTAHAVEEYPDECCGVVIEKPDGSQQVVRIRNVQNEMHALDPERYPRTARTAYSGHPADLKAALDLADTPGCSLRAFYHSHPDHDAYFSDEDVAQATPFGEPNYPGALQVVVSVYGGEFREMKSFAWNADTANFEEVG